MVASAIFMRWRSKRHRSLGRISRGWRGVRQIGYPHLLRERELGGFCPWLACPLGPGDTPIWDGLSLFANANVHPASFQPEIKN